MEDSGTRLGLLRHPALWIEQLLDSWTFHSQSDIVGLAGDTYIDEKDIHSISSVTLENPNEYRLEFEMSPTGSCIWTLGLQLESLFGKTLEPSRGGASLEEVGSWAEL